MAKTLSTGEKDLEMTNALKLFGKDTLDLIYPDHESRVCKEPSCTDDCVYEFALTENFLTNSEDIMH